MTRTLVLNSGWVPINVVDALDAVCDVFTGRATFLDTRTFVTHDFESWVENWDDAIAEAHANSMRVISTSSLSLVLPEIVVLLDYKGMGSKTKDSRRPKFSRSNVYRRDKNTCQYCGHKFKTDELELEHVHPKSQGGAATWKNIVLACTPCNRKKDNRTPQQAGMRLIKEPRIPKAGELASNPMEKLRGKIGSKPLRTWEHFIGKMYWEVELK